MILTNERVAELCERRNVPTVYRVHEQPDPQRVERLADQLASLGVPTPPLPDPEHMSSSEAGELVGEISRVVAKEADRCGHGRDAYTSLVLRSLKQAYYSERNLGHAGLGSTAYAHFTSPIRRYPDLVAHRALLSAVGAGEAEPHEAREAAWRSSAREREATAIERDADSVCASFLLGRELFERGWKRAFEGEVSGVIGAGAFVRFGGELGDVYEGLMPVRLMRSDHFDLNETETALVGRSSGREIRLGDPLSVRVDRIEATRGRVDLIPADEGGSRGGARHDRRQERR
jgi:ribonuclease R